jgi:hypothetical protein
MKRIIETVMRTGSKSNIRTRPDLTKDPKNHIPDRSQRREQNDLFGKYAFDISFLKWTRQFIDKNPTK